MLGHFSDHNKACDLMISRELFTNLGMDGCQAVLNDKPVTDYFIAKRKNKDFVTMSHLYNPDQSERYL